MEKKLNVQRTVRKPSLIIGAVLLAAVVGISGCGAAATAASGTSGQSSQTQSNGQSGQGQHMRNPAQMAAMSIRRLEADTQNPLTADQKNKLKSILQDLVNTTNPTQDFLQQKADAINAVFTDQQKSDLSSANSQGRPQRQAQGGGQGNASSSSSSSSSNSGSTSGSSSGSSSGNTSGNQGANKAGGQNGSVNGSYPRGGANGQPKGNFNPQEIYQQILDSLNK